MKCYFVNVDAEDDKRAEGIKSPVVMALDKLLGEYYSLHSFFSKLIDLFL